MDSFGRQRAFHGTNCVVKGPPWIPSRDGFDQFTSLTAKDFELMRSAGVNAIRLAHAPALPLPLQAALARPALAQQAGWLASAVSTPDNRTAAAKRRAAKAKAKAKAKAAAAAAAQDSIHEVFANVHETFAIFRSPPFPRRSR